MTGDTFVKKVRKNTFTNSNTLSETDILLYANIEKDELAETINREVDEDYFQMTLKRDLKADTREYTFPNDIIRNLKRVSAKLDGENWQVLWETDITQVRDPLVTESNVQDAFSGNDRKTPALDIQGRGFRILNDDAITEVTNGLQIEAMIYPSNLTTAELTGARNGVDLSIPASDIKHAMPRAIHKVWVLRTSIAYKQSRPKPIPLNAEEKQVEGFLQRSLNNLKIRNNDRSYIPSAPKNNGLDY